MSYAPTNSPKKAICLSLCLIFSTQLYAAEAGSTLQTISRCLVLTKNCLDTILATTDLYREAKRNPVLVGVSVAGLACIIAILVACSRESRPGEDGGPSVPPPYYVPEKEGVKSGKTSDIKYATNEDPTAKRNLINQENTQ